MQINNIIIVNIPPNPLKFKIDIPILWYYLILFVYLTFCLRNDLSFYNSDNAIMQN